ncbi:hypothetical protein BC941DRAFT_432377 [Chlamydoabsidia padenii]|nr:hypothetical protein BC941DRAFT_432377 [Chlamydoabsidia padenii]
MTLLGLKYRKKATSPKGSTSTTIHQSTLLSRLPPNASSPCVYQQQQQQQQYTTHLSNHTSPTLSDYSSTDSMITPFDSPTPTPSISWTSEMSAFVDKLRDDAAALVGSTKYQQQMVQQQQQQQQQQPLDRRSVSQGMKLVAIAADEYEEGNDDVALDIYLSGIDKILMALPNKTDSRTKLALREKLLSVEERVGILNLALQQYNRPNHLDQEEEATDSTTTTTTATSTNIDTTSMLSRISMTINTISHLGTTTAKAWEANKTTMQRYDHQPQDSVFRFKRFGRFVINTSATCAVVIKQSPIPDLIGILFGYFIHMLCYLDHHYKVRDKMQKVGIECIKLGLAADEHYHLHELASETLYVLIAASLKAAVAYKESPSYRQTSLERTTTSPVDQHPVNEIPQIEYQDTPPPPSRFTWISWS